MTYRITNPKGKLVKRTRTLENAIRFIKKQHRNKTHYMIVKQKRNKYKLIY